MCCHLLVKHQLCVSEMQITKSVLQPDPNTVSCVSERAEVLLPSQQRPAVVLGVNTSLPPEHHVQNGECKLSQHSL